MAEFFECFWGGVRLWLARISTDNGRSLVVQEATRGDVPWVDDRGRAPHRVTCSLLFDQMIRETTSPKERFLRFKALAEQGKPQVFTHPLEGSFLARLGRFDHVVDQDGVISAEVEFIAVEETRTIEPLDLGGAAAAGEEAVAAAADAADAALAAADLESDLPGDAKAASAGWLGGAEVDARQVFVDVGSLSERIGAEIADLQLETDLALWSVFKAYVLLDEAIRAAGGAAIGEGTIFTIRLAAQSSLRPLLATMYPADEVDERMRQALALNVVANPTRLEPGTELRLPQPAPRARTG